MRKIEMIVYEGEDLKPEVRWTPLSSGHEELWVWKYGDKARMSTTRTNSNAPQEASILLNIQDKPERVTIYRDLKDHVGLEIINDYRFGQEDYRNTIIDVDNRLLQNPKQGGQI